MDARTLRLLQYDVLLAQAAALARTEVGREWLLALSPSADGQEVQRSLAKTREAKRLLRVPEPLLRGVHDIRASLRRAERGGVLTPEELYRVGETAKGLSVTAERIFERTGEAPLLADVARAITPEPELEQVLFTSVDEDGVKDGASTLLKSLREEIRATENRLRDTLEGYVRDRNLGRYLQEALITQRNGRYVLPVKAEYKAQIPGIVHDVSQSGATVFVEPQAAVVLGNRLAQLRRAEEKEVERVLRVLSQRVGRRAPTLLRSLAAAAEIDAHLARAALGSDWQGDVPAVGGRRLIIRRGRHPLLGPGAVPLDLELPEDARVLVVTGPNTGGKTVALKTVALFALLAQSGFPLPADNGTQLPLFDGVYADIGDEQSIEQNLSTFSSHMGAIAAILSQATERSLVVLDEIGAGTDPVEGAALAVAIVEHLLAVGALTLVTTHFGELKALAQRRAGVHNASVTFDPETLRPTYQLVLGRPGASNALHIAARLGLPEDVLARARRELGPERVATAELLLRLEEERSRLSAERQAASSLRQELEERLAEEKRRAEAAARAAEEALAKARAQARELVREAKAELRGLMQEARRRSLEARRDEDWAEVREALRRWDERTETPAAEPRGLPGDLAVGAAVEIVSLGQRGRVVELRGDEAWVEVGMVRVQVPRRDLRPVADAAPGTGGGSTGLVLAKAASIRPEVDLRGLDSQSALELLDKYLDDALLAGLAEVRVIHGKGTGALRRAVGRHLRAHPAVAEVRLGAYGEGEDGVTIARLKA